jgi:CDP-diglyceride synthetase
MRTILDFLTAKKFRNIFTLLCLFLLIYKYYFGNRSSELAQNFWIVLILPIVLYFLLTPSFESGALGVYDNEATFMDMFLRLFTFVIFLYFYVMIFLGI